MIRTNCLLAMLCIALPFIGIAQSAVSWNFSTQKISVITCEIHLTPVVQSPWYIYSQSGPESGALQAKIGFNKKPLLTIEGKAGFVQVITLRQAQGDKANMKTNFSGSVEFITCNNEQCLPSKAVSFNEALP